MLNSDAEIKTLIDQIQGLQVEKARLNDRRASGGAATQAYRQSRLNEIEAEINEINEKLHETAVAGAIGKGA
jgi:phage host-nuclease inhibitor protein Gam